MEKKSTEKDKNYVKLNRKHVAAQAKLGIDLVEAKEMREMLEDEIFLQYQKAEINIDAERFALAVLRATQKIFGTLKVDDLLEILQALYVGGAAEMSVKVHMSVRTRIKALEKTSKAKSK